MTIHAGAKAGRQRMEQRQTDTRRLCKNRQTLEQMQTNTKPNTAMQIPLHRQPDDGTKAETHCNRGWQTLDQMWTQIHLCKDRQTLEPRQTYTFAKTGRHYSVRHTLQHGRQTLEQRQTDIGSQTGQHYNKGRQTLQQTQTDTGA